MQLPMNDFSRFPGAPEIGTDDKHGRIELVIPAKELEHLRPTCIAQTIPRYPVLRVAYDDSLLVGEAVSMANREVPVSQALVIKQVIQFKIPEYFSRRSIVADFAGSCTIRDMKP
jgi:hypothetical protein